MIRKGKSVVAVAVFAVAVVCALAVPAGANHLKPGTKVSVSCASVSAQYEAFSSGDLPITFHVSANGGPSNVLVSSASATPSGTASVDISALTNFEGASGTVSAYVTWNGHAAHEGTDTVSIVCGEVPPTTTPPPPTTTTLPEKPDDPGVVPKAAVVVVAAPAFTG